MATSKIINTIKVTSDYLGKVLKIGLSGNLEPAVHRKTAIIEEAQSAGLYPTGDSSATTASNWWNAATTNYDDNSYTESIQKTAGQSSTARFFKRHLNTIRHDPDSIVEELTEDYNFVLSEGTYRIYGWVYSADMGHSMVRLKNGTGYGTVYAAMRNDSRPDSHANCLQFDFYIEVSGTESERTFGIENCGTEYNNSGDLGFPLDLASGLDETYVRIYIENLD